MNPLDYTPLGMAVNGMLGEEGEEPGGEAVPFDNGLSGSSMCANCGLDGVPPGAPCSLCGTGVGAAK